MSRSGYSDSLDQWDLIRWRGAVASAIRGKRGQSFLKELRTSLDAMPEKRLIAHNLELNGEVCAIGSVGRDRKIDMAKLDPEDSRDVARAFDVSKALAAEIEYMNDEAGPFRETPEDRYHRMSKWVDEQLAGAPLSGDTP